jgi:hypothetical protein
MGEGCHIRRGKAMSLGRLFENSDPWPKFAHGARQS